MRARRLPSFRSENPKISRQRRISIEILAAVLVLALALPCVGLGELALRGYRIEYNGVDEYGQPAVLPLVEGQDFFVQYADEAQMHVWFQIQAELPPGPVRISADYMDGGDVYTYVFFDTLNNTEWLDMTGSDISPVTLSLQGSMGILPGKRVTLCDYPYSGMPVDAGTEEGGENGGWTDPGDGGWTDPGDGGWTDPGDGGWTDPGDGGWTDPGDSGWTDPGDGGWTDPGDGGWTDPGDSDWTDPGDGGWTDPGDGGWTDPGDSGWTDPGDSGWTDPGDSGWTDPGDSGWTDPGDGGWTDPGDSGWTDPGDSGWISTGVNAENAQQSGETDINPEQTLPPDRESNLGRVIGGVVLYETPYGNPVETLAEETVVLFELELEEEGIETTILDVEGRLWLRVTVLTGPQAGLAGYLPLDAFVFLPGDDAQVILDSLAAEEGPGGNEPGGNEPGGNEPGGNEPGGNEPGGNEPGGNEPGGNEPGGNEPGGNEPGGNEPGGNEPGGNEPGGNEPEPLPPDTSRHAEILENLVNVRRSPGPSGTPFATVSKKDSPILVTGQQTGLDGNQWYEVSLQDAQTGEIQIGYIRSDSLRLYSLEEEETYLSQQNSPEPSPPEPTQATAAPTETVTPAPSETATPAPVRGYMKTNQQYALVYAWPNIGAPSVAVLDLGTVVYVQEQVEVQGNLWSYVNYQGSNWGYIPDAYLSTMTAAEVQQHFANQVPSPSAAPTYSPATFSGYAVLTSNSVNFRATASTSGSVLRRLSYGTIVRVISEKTAEGYTWYYCESGGQQGYLRGDMLQLLSVQQYTSLVQSPSYAQNGAVITPTATANPGNINTSTWATVAPNATITFTTIPPLGTEEPSPSPNPDASPTIDPDATPEVTLPPAEETPDVTAEPPDFPTEDSGGFSVSGLLIALVVLLVLAAGGFYGYSVYNKARRKQAQDQAKRLAAEARRKTQEAEGARPAVRRPAPSDQPGVPGTAQARPQPAPGSHAGARPPSQQPNPYVRPPVQEVTSTLPRAQVDGRPVSGGQQPNPYARPPARPQGTLPTARPTLPGGASYRPGERPPQPPASSGYARPAPPSGEPRGPVAPPPVVPDTANEPTPRRRRRSETPREE